MSGQRKQEAADAFTSGASLLGEGEGGRAGDEGGVLTVESLLVHDGAAAQGLVVLLVAHQRVHAQDSCGDTGAL